MTRPHVFVTMGGLLNFKCDAWLLPTDCHLSFNPHWIASLPIHGVKDPEQLRPRFASFFEAARKGLQQRPLGERLVPLVAVPFFGTGLGAGNIYRGDILRVLMEEATSASQALGIDVAFVFQDQAAYALAQQLRKEPSAGSWAALNPRLQSTAKDLAARAASGQIVPFMGAGVSMSAGAPDWQGLLRAIALHRQLPPVLNDSLKSLPVLDQASIIKSLYQSSATPQKSFGQVVADAVDLPRYGLPPALLAGLPGSAAITLNYDRLFEMAAEDAGSPRTVIPDDISSTTGKYGWHDRRRPQTSQTNAGPCRFTQGS